MKSEGLDAPAGPAGGPLAGRRLAAILHADVVGYSRLMGADEAGTHARLMAARSLIDGLFAAHGGRMVGTAGDSVLAVFESVVGALACALAMQAALAERDAAAPEKERLSFRVGVAIGDVIFDNGDVFGEGVNVAARIEALAEPGGVAVTAAVRDQVGGRLPVRFVDRGVRRLKNIEPPVRVFSVVPVWDRAAPARPGSGRLSARPMSSAARSSARPGGSASASSSAERPTAR